MNANAFKNAHACQECLGKSATAVNNMWTEIIPIQKGTIGHSLIKFISVFLTGLEIVLDDVTWQLTRTASCCGSCNNSSYESIELVCKCQPACVIYGDCCLDYALFCTDIETGTSGHSLVGMENCTKDRVNSSFTKEGKVSTSED